MCCAYVCGVCWPDSFDIQHSVHPLVVRTQLRTSPQHLNRNRNRRTESGERSTKHEARSTKHGTTRQLQRDTTNHSATTNSLRAISSIIVCVVSVWRWYMCLQWWCVLGASNDKPRTDQAPIHLKKQQTALDLDQHLEHEIQELIIHTTHNITQHPHNHHHKTITSDKAHTQHTHVRVCLCYDIMVIKQTFNSQPNSY